MKINYTSADFSEVKDFFNGFAEGDVLNFHYANLTNYNSRVPGPTMYTIEGYFELSEENWGKYVVGTDWLEVKEPYRPQISDSSANYKWLQSFTWNDIHRGKRIYGGFNICNEARIVFFSLSQN